MIRFMHIPKSAGSTFKYSLLNVYDFAPFFEFDGNLEKDRQRLLEMSPRKREALQVITGHAPLVTGIDGVDSFPCITFLREPIARVRSYCRHVSEGKSRHLIARFPPDHFDLHAFLSSGDGGLENVQCRHLVGDEFYRTHSSDETCKRAIQVLTNELKAFGVVEFFDVSMLLFKHVFGWTRYPVYRNSNQSSQKSNLIFDERALEKIRSLNELDCMVYAQAKELFLKEIEDLSLEEELIEYRQINAAGASVLARRLKLRAVLRKCKLISARY